MGGVNSGDQIVSIQYFDPADAYIFNRRHSVITPRGIYQGGYLEKVSDTKVNLSPLLCEIGKYSEVSGVEDIIQAKVRTRETVAIDVSPSTPYIILRWEYAESSNNYMDILAVASIDIQEGDLIVGRCVFSGSVLTGFDYSERSVPNVWNLFLKVEPTDPASMRVRIRAGRVTYGVQNFDIYEQVTSNFTAPSSNPRIDLVYVDTDGVVKIKTGTEGNPPSVPSYDGKIVLAEVTLVPGMTEITTSRIKDVRGLLGCISIDSLSEKPILIHDDDLILIEDSEDGNKKKKVKKRSLEGCNIIENVPKETWTDIYSVSNSYVAAYVIVRVGRMQDSANFRTYFLLWQGTYYGSEVKVISSTDGEGIQQPVNASFRATGTGGNGPFKLQVNPSDLAYAIAKICIIRD